MNSIKEGCLYKTIKIRNHIFDIFYGYFSEEERGKWEPTPIFPDFKKTPRYTDEGLQFARADQDICEHYTPKPKTSEENWCNDCVYFKICEELIGICTNDKRRLMLRQNE